MSLLQALDRCLGMCLVSAAHQLEAQGDLCSWRYELCYLSTMCYSLAAHQAPDLAACGAWVLAERRCLCHMAKARPTGEEWRAWYARLCKWIEQYHDHGDAVGRFARPLLRERDSLWVFLAHHGVKPTNNRAERALRIGVLWRKRSHGTASTKGNRWVERILSLQETYRLQARATYAMLVDAVTRYFHGHQPDLSWLDEGEQRFTSPVITYGERPRDGTS